MRFLTKLDKRQRLDKEIEVLKGGETSYEELARTMGVDRATIERDLLTLSDEGVPVYEGKRGRLGLAEWFLRRKK